MRMNERNTVDTRFIDIVLWSHAPVIMKQSIIYLYDEYRVKRTSKTCKRFLCSALFCYSVKLNLSIVHSICIEPPPPSPPRTHTHSNKHRRKWNSTMCLTPFVCHCLLSLALRRSALAIGIFDSIVISNLWLFNLEYCCSIPWAIVCAARFVAIANDDCYCGIDHSFQSRTHTQTHHVHYIRKIWSNIFKWVLFTAYYLLLPFPSVF